MALREVVGSWTVQIEVGGYVRFDLQPTNSRHRHNFFELCLVLEGRGQYFHGGLTFPLIAGDVFLAEPGVIHEINSFETRDLSLYFLRMSVQEGPAAPLQTEDRGFEAFQRRRFTVAAGPSRLLHFPPLLDPTGHPFPTLLRAFTRELVACLAETSPSEPPPPLRDDLSEALRFIDAHHQRRVQVSEVAAHLGVSERTLRRRFEREKGTTISQEINHRRMRFAADHLLRGVAVAEVANLVGIEDPAQFTRAFQRSFGVSPKTFQMSYFPGVAWEQTRP